MTQKDENQAAKASWQTQIADLDATDMRLDKWLASWSQLSRVRLRGLIENGEVRADGVIIKRSRSGTLVHALLYHCKDSLSGIGGVMRPGIVHRIDKDTSGVLVVAKSDQAHQYLSRQFAKHTVERVYICLARSAPKPRSGRIESRIARSPHDRKKQAVIRGTYMDMEASEHGRHAITNYAFIKGYGQAARTKSESIWRIWDVLYWEIHFTANNVPLTQPSQMKKLPFEMRLRRLNAKHCMRPASGSNIPPRKPSCDLKRLYPQIWLFLIRHSPIISKRSKGIVMPHVSRAGSA